MSDCPLSSRTKTGRTLPFLIALFAGALLVSVSDAANKVPHMKRAAPEENVTPPPASIDSKNRPADWRNLKPFRVGDPPKIPQAFWHNPVIYNDGYVYARGWVTRVLPVVSRDGDVCFNVALDEPYLGLRNNSNASGQIHVEISAYIKKKYYGGEMQEAVNTSVETIYKEVGVPPGTPGLTGKAKLTERDARHKVFVEKLNGKYVEVLGVWVNDTGHDPRNPWREIHPCIRLRILDAPAGRAPSNKTRKAGIKEVDDEEKEEEEAMERKEGKKRK